MHTNPYLQIIFSSPPSSTEVSFMISPFLLSWLLFLYHAPLFLFHLITFISLLLLSLSLSNTRIFTHLCCSIWSSDHSSHHHQHCCHQFSHLKKEIAKKKQMRTQIWGFVLCAWIWDLIQFIMWCIFGGFVICYLLVFLCSIHSVKNRENNLRLLL